MNCINCGAEIREGKKFCSNCGAPASAPVPSPAHCTNCGAKLEPGETFCSNCGTRASTQDGSAASAPAPPASAAAPAPVSPAMAPQQLRCTNCGAPMGASEAFCTECGSRQAPKPPPAFGSPARPAVAPAQQGSGVAPAPLAKAVQGVEFKGIGLRFVAALIDTILYYAFAWFVASRAGGTTSTGFELTGVPFALSSLVWLAYYILLEGYLGGTIGKLVLGMRVVNARGVAPGPVPALVRNLMRIVDFLPLFYLLGIALIASSKQKQRLGDRVAGTFVVSRAGARAMKAAGSEMRGAGGTPVVIAGLVVLLAGLVYLLWAQPGPVAQVAGAFSGLPVVGGLIPKQGPATPTKTASPSPATPTVPPRATAAPTAAATAPARPTVAPTPVPPASGSASSGTGLSQSDLGGNWKGAVAFASYTSEGMGDREKQAFDAEFKKMQGQTQVLEVKIEPKSNDSGNITMTADGDPLGPLPYRYQNGKMTFEYSEGGARGAFEAFTNRKGNSLVLDGTMKMIGQEGAATITVMATWTATKQ